MTIPVPNYGLDTDRILSTDSLPAAIRRRFRGQYAVDEFGADPHLMDLSAGLAALPRAGNLAAAPLAPTWFRSGPGEPPRALLVSTLGFPVLPVAVHAGFPFALPGRRWRVRFGEPLFPPAGT